MPVLTKPTGLPAEDPSDSSTSANTDRSVRWDGCGHLWQVTGPPNPTPSTMSHMTEGCVFCGLAGETIEGEHSSARRAFLPDSPASGNACLTRDGTTTITPVRRSSCATTAIPRNHTDGSVVES